jgi:hypothetical protein
MKRRKPDYWKNNAVRQAEQRYLREKKTSIERMNDISQATADVYAMCILSAAYDKYGIGEARLLRVADVARTRSERYGQTKNGLPRLVGGKKKTGAELAELDLRQDVAAYFPADFMLPTYQREKKDMKRAAMIKAADTVARLYAYGMHEALGFGLERVSRVLEEANSNYCQFREWAKNGDYYGYSLLARKMGEILHSPCEVDTAGTNTPIFGKTLD